MPKMGNAPPSFGSAPQGTAHQRVTPGRKRATLLRLCRYVMCFRFRVILALLLTVLSNYFGLMGPYLSGLAVDSIGSKAGTVQFPLVFRYCLFMALFYVAGCLYILCVNSAFVWPAIRLICISAFDPAAVGGGFAGGSVMLAARYGIARGLFSNESGLGSAPIVAAAAQTRNPVRQALVSSSGTFWDTVVICALTGIVVVSSILAYPDITYTDGGSLTNAAFSKIPVVGRPVLTFGLVTFAFSTILGWSYYGERAMEYLKGNRWTMAYRMLYIIALFVGSVANLNMVWNIADCFNALMAIPNLLSLLLLSGVLVKETDKYLWSGHLDAVADEDVEAGGE